MAPVLTILSYKLRFFFGPALRGRGGPLLYLLLIIILAPSGFGFGVSLGELVKASGFQAAVDFLATPLAGGLSLALLLSLFGGVTAHVSEFDFFMTAPIRAREYLAADLLFQIASLIGTGGLAMAVAAVALVVTTGGTVALALPLLGLLLAYLVFVLMVMQVLVVLTIRHRGWPLRGAIIAMLLVSLLPSLFLARSDLPLRFNTLPFPSTAFASLAVAILKGTAPDPSALGLGLTYVGVVGLVWYVASDSYIFHGLKPLLSAGFGQMSASYTLEKERRMIRGFGGLTRGVKLRPERGGDTMFMASLHGIRSLRDGSLLFVALYVLIASAPTVLGGRGTPGTVVVTGLLSFPLAFLAVNWAFYERDNLWILLTAAKPLGAYFRGLMVSLAVTGLVVAGIALAVLGLVSPSSLTLDSAANPMAGSLVAAVAASALVTRIRPSPGAFSLGALVLLAVVSILGSLGGLALQGLLLASEVYLGWGAAPQAAVMMACLAALALAGFRVLDRLARTFHL